MDLELCQRISGVLDNACYSGFDTPMLDAVVENSAAVVRARLAED